MLSKDLIFAIRGLLWLLLCIKRYLWPIICLFSEYWRPVICLFSEKGSWKRNLWQQFWASLNEGGKRTMLEKNVKIKEESDGQLWVIILETASKFHWIREEGPIPTSSQGVKLCVGNPFFPGSRGSFRQSWVAAVQGAERHQIWDHFQAGKGDELWLEPGTCGGEDRAEWTSSWMHWFPCRQVPRRP